MVKKELAGEEVRLLKAELKRRGVTRAKSAKQLEGHGLKETEVSITSNLACGMFAATFVLACLAALGMRGMQLADL